ncbi:MAG TPA: hypothetical protein PKY82_08970 [Pyrinomonadaceae bacterium]|nr:hypothetical protein [Pyrinomonadaceae bacterium]
MDIPEAKFRQKNVQQQNAVTKESIRREAEFYKTNGIPEALRLYGETQGVDWNRSIILNLEIDFPGMPSLWGMFLTQQKEFIEFEIETDEQHSKIIEIETWKNVTNEQNFSYHNQGIGVGFGALALEVWQELEDKNK